MSAGCLLAINVVSLWLASGIGGCIALVLKNRPEAFDALYEDEPLALAILVLALILAGPLTLAHAMLRDDD